MGHWALPAGVAGFCSSRWGCGSMVTPLQERQSLFMLPAGDVSLLLLLLGGDGYW